MPTSYVGHEPRDDDRSMGELFSELSGEVQQLLHKEVELAKLEAREQMSKATKAGVLFGGSAVAGLFGGLLVSFAAAWGAAEVIPAGLAFLAVGLLYLVVAGLCFVQARKRLAHFRPVPEQTVQTVKEDVRGVKHALSRGASTEPSSNARRS